MRFGRLGEKALQERRTAADQSQSRRADLDEPRRECVDVARGKLS